MRRLVFALTIAVVAVVAAQAAPARADDYAAVPRPVPSEAGSAEAPAPPPLRFTLVWVDFGAPADDDASPADRKRTTRRTVYVLYGNQLTRTVHWDDRAKGNDVMTKAVVKDTDEIAALTPSFKEEQRLTLPTQPGVRGNRIDVSFTFGGDDRLFNVSGETPKQPTKELAALIALRESLERALAPADED